MNKKFEIMDVTLRDGSYAIGFQFSQYDTECVCMSLDKSNIDYIEIGHGMGINASSKDNGLAMCTDEEYLSVAQKCIPNAKYGMFCIPKYAKIESLDMMRQYGASFVRVGTNVTDVKMSCDFIKRAKKNGLLVAANYMKSYVVSPMEFAENVRMSESYGVDIVYLVDSAGSMGREQIKAYYDAIRSVSNIRLGFHGHNNLGLAISNALYAIELGFDLVDTSIMGMGRSSGNAATELLIGNLIKKGIANKYNLKEVLRCAERYIKPLWKHYPNALDLYCGIAEFHTSYMNSIKRVSIKYKVNPLDLILEYSKYDKVDMNENKLEKIATKMPVDNECNYTDFGFNEYIGNEQSK